MDTLVDRDIERFIYHESDLLDERRLDAWLGLLADDVKYWVPNFDENGRPGENGVIVYEDISGLRARVARAQHILNPTQMPPARTRHFVTNVQVTSRDDREADVSCNVLLYVSKNDRLAHYPGKIEYKLRIVDGAWRIGEKKIYLITNNVALGSLPLF